jgi:hypothetical protein
MSQSRFAVNFFFESSGYEFILSQDIVHRFEGTSMVWGDTKISKGFFVTLRGVTLISFPPVAGILLRQIPHDRITPCFGHN